MRFHRRSAVSSLLIVLTALTLAFGCGPQGPSEEASESESTSQSASSDFPVTVTDSVGREVEIEEEPQEIASMAPSITETIFAVGAGERVVGVTTADDYPEEVTDIETVGDYQQINVEKLLELETDLLFLSFDTTVERAEELEEQTNADVIVIDPPTLDATLDSMVLVGDAVGEPENGREVRSEMRSDLDEIEDAVSDEPEPTVFFELYGDPLQTVGPGSFIDDALEAAGGRNIAADTGEEYPSYSEETIIRKDPDYYLVGSLSGTTVADVENRPEFSRISAVTEDNVEIVDDDLLSRPGPRIVDGVLQIAEAIHPKAFDGAEGTD